MLHFRVGMSILVWDLNLHGKKLTDWKISVQLIYSLPCSAMLVKPATHSQSGKSVGYRYSRELLLFGRQPNHPQIVLIPTDAFREELGKFFSTFWEYALSLFFQHFLFPCILFLFFSPFDFFCCSLKIGTKKSMGAPPWELPLTKSDRPGDFRQFNFLRRL